MKQIGEVGPDEMAEVVVRGDMLPSLREWAVKQGYLFQPLPVKEDSHYHSFVMVEPTIPREAIEGLTEEQIAGYGAAWDEAVGGWGSEVRDVRSRAGPPRHGRRRLPPGPSLHRPGVRLVLR